MIIHGQHKRLDLAQRRVRELQGAHGGKWRISSRRNANGKVSSRGHFYSFSRVRKKKPGQEYQINVKYGSKANRPEVQISVRGPAGLSRKQVIAAVEHRMRDGSNPKGLKVRIKWWERAGNKIEGEKATDENAWAKLGQFFGLAETSLGKRGRPRKRK